MHSNADMLTDATLLLVALGLVVGGSVFVVAAYRRWAWLVDPPTRFAWLGGHFLIRYLIGKRAMRYVVYALGVGNIALGLYGILSILLF